MSSNAHAREPLKSLSLSGRVCDHESILQHVTSPQSASSEEVRSMTTQVMESAAGALPAYAGWDYSVVSIHARHNDVLEEKLKECGRDGWELFFMSSPT